MEVIILSTSQAFEVYASNQLASLKSHTVYLYGEATLNYVQTKNFKS